MNTKTIANTFLEKLKEQSFTIILMIGGLYYQNQIFENQLNQYKSIVAEKETYINKIVDEEIGRAHADSSHT